jgi:hypothetical protein
MPLLPYIFMVEEKKKKNSISWEKKRVCQVRLKSKVPSTYYLLTDLPTGLEVSRTLCLFVVHGVKSVIGFFRRRKWHTPKCDWVFPP